MYLVRFYDEGFKDGYDHGKVHGVIEGRALGRQKGYEIWEELGFYEGFTTFWKGILRTNTANLRGTQNAADDERNE